METIPSNRIDGYRWLIETKGFELIKLQRKNKVPVRHESGWAKRTERRSFDDIRLNVNDNAGVLTGRMSGILVLDIDNDKLFPHDHAIPETFTVKTSKGFHHYFKLPDDGKYYGNRAIQQQGFDIRGEGGYVVAPWSTHPDGSRYRLVNDTELTEAPQWLLDLSSETASSKPKNASTTSKTLTPSPMTPPATIKLPSHHEKLIKDGIKKGKRSDKIWHLLNDLVGFDYSDDEIGYVFEGHPKGIGQKYFEKGGSRLTWLQGEIKRARKHHGNRYAPPIEANDQAAVKTLLDDILATLRKYNPYVSDSQGAALEDVVNLFIAMYEGSDTGWYAIPLPVGAGKTTTILHFIKFLHTHDTNRSFPISIAFEKITEIEDAAAWLKDHGVPDDFYQVMHHKVADHSEALKKLKGASVLLHTHHKLKGSAYQNDYFSYKGKPRKLLVFDESMLNSLVSSDYTDSIVSWIDRFQRKYDQDDDFSKKIDSGIYNYFTDLKKLIDVQEKALRAEGTKEIHLQVDTSHLDMLDYSRLVSAARIIEDKLGDNDLFSNLLQIGIAPKSLRTFTLIKQQGKPVLLAYKELLSDSIENLITTDASREFRKLFKYTTRADGQQIRIYDVDNFRMDDEVSIKGIELPSGQRHIKKTFEDYDDDNEYLKAIVEIVKQHNENEETETAMNGGKSPGKRKYLFFHSKQIKCLPYQVIFKLADEGLVPLENAKERLKFVTFGRENATNEYSDCDVVIFIGLNHKPQHAIRALLAGEGFTGDPQVVKTDVETGELIQQLQQGIGRGQMRKGLRQAVYFFHPNPMEFAGDIEKAFPMCDYAGSTTLLLSNEEADAMAKVTGKDFEYLTKNQ